MIIKQISYLIYATTKYTTTEFNTTKDTTTDHDYDYSTTTEYMKAKYNRTEDTTTHYHYDYSTAEENMTKKDTAIENNSPKSRLIQNNTLRSQEGILMALIITKILVKMERILTYLSLIYKPCYFLVKIGDPCTTGNECASTACKNGICVGRFKE